VFENNFCCAKAFQTVTKMKTVSGKRLPSNHRISKVHGSTFYLPLPMEETLKNFLHIQNPYQLNSELYILMWSIPNKSNIVWQEMVNVNKVHRALSKLQELNPLYQHISLPTVAADLHIQERIGEIESDAAIIESEAATDDPVYTNDEPVVDDLQQEVITDE